MRLAVFLFSLFILEAFVATSCATGPSYLMDVTFRQVRFDGQTPSDEVVSATSEQQAIRIEGTLYLMSTCGVHGGTLEDADADLTVRLHRIRQGTKNKDCPDEPGFVAYTAVIRQLPIGTFHLRVIHEYGGDPYDERVALEETLDVPRH
jgi:hypothetical protein